MMFTAPVHSHDVLTPAGARKGGEGVAASYLRIHVVNF